MLGRIKNRIQKQYFYPDFLGIFINPTYLSRRALAGSISELSRHLKGKTLDIGCGSKPYQPLLTHATEYIGMEYAASGSRLREEADVFYDGKRFPFPDGSFDSAIATEVLEHVFNPDEFLEETNRVLKGGGTLLLTSPFMWSEHQKPYDYGRYSSFGISHLVREHGFEILVQKKNVTGILAVSQILAIYVRNRITVRSYHLRLFLYILFAAPCTIMGILWSKILPGESDLYISNVLLLRKYVR